MVIAASRISAAQSSQRLGRYLGLKNSRRSAASSTPTRIMTPATNPNVVRAQRQLAKELITLGAMPAIASLPPGKNGAKQGLDDLLVAQGAAALEKIISDAPFFPEAEALWSLSEEVVYVREPG